MLAQLVLYGLAGLTECHALQEYLGGAGRLDGAVCTYALVHLGLGVAEDGDMDFVAFTQYVGIWGLCTIGGAEHVHRGAGKE